jgi:hypothetical protein
MLKDTSIRSAQTLAQNVVEEYTPEATTDIAGLARLCSKTMITSAK